MFKEKGSDEIVIKAMGRAINKTIMIVELIKVLLLTCNLDMDVMCCFCLASDFKSLIDMDMLSLHIIETKVI